VWFDRVVLILIAANTVTLMVDRYPMADSETYVLDVVNFVLSVGRPRLLLFFGELLFSRAAFGLTSARTRARAFRQTQVCFMFEMLAKLAAFGVYGYCCEVSNVLDGTIVVLGTVEYFDSPPEFISGVQPHEAGVISAFRCVRLFRIFKVHTALIDYAGHFIYARFYSTVVVKPTRLPQFHCVCAAVARMEVYARFVG